LLILTSGIAGWWYWNSSGKSQVSLKEKTTWLEALQKNDTVAYQQYLLNFPGGEYASVAQEKIDSLIAAYKIITDSVFEDSIWQQVLIENTKEGYEKYINDFRSGKYINLAYQNITMLEAETNLAAQDSIQVTKLSSAPSFFSDETHLEDSYEIINLSVRDINVMLRLPYGYRQNCDQEDFTRQNFWHESIVIPAGGQRTMSFEGDITDMPSGACAALGNYELLEAKFLEPIQL
jgi:hypothetical protein